MKGSNLDPKRWWVLTAIVLAFLPVVIDMTVLHVAIPSLTQSLNASNTDILWVIDIYPLLMAGLLVPMGTLADRVGNRKILLLGLIIFGLASTIAAFSHTAAMLIGARSLLAVGGAMIMPCVLGIIRRTFEDTNERAMALGIWGAVGSSGAAIGPLIGGGLLEYFWWGSVFLINVPIMIIVFPTCYFLLSGKEITTSGKWEFGQAILLIVGLIALVYAMKVGIGGTHSLISVLFFTFLGAISLIIFVIKQLKSAKPMLDLSLFSKPVILAGIIMAMVVSGALAGVELTLAMELQYVIDLTAFEAGIFMIPIMVAAAIGGPIAGLLLKSFELRLIAPLSLLTSAIALAGLAYSDFHNPGFTVPFILAITGLSLSIGLTASSIAIMGSVHVEDGAAAGSLESTGYELGTGLGITLFGIFMANIFTKNIKIPNDINTLINEKPIHSIGDIYLAANQLSSEQSEVLISIAKTAFSAAHVTLLSSAALIIGSLAIIIFFMLSKIR